MLTSQWMRISYFKNIISDFPDIDSKNVYMLPKNVKLALKIIFPLGFLYLLYIKIKQINTIKKLESVKKLSKSILNVFDNPGFLLELEMQL